MRRVTVSIHRVSDYLNTRSRGNGLDGASAEERPQPLARPDDAGEPVSESAQASIPACLRFGMTLPFEFESCGDPVWTSIGSHTDHYENKTRPRIDHSAIWATRVRRPTSIKTPVPEMTNGSLRHQERADLDDSRFHSPLPVSYHSRIKKDAGYRFHSGSPKELWSGVRL